MIFRYRPELSPTKVNRYKASRSFTLHSALVMFLIEIATISAVNKPDPKSSALFVCFYCIIGKIYEETD